MSTITFGMLLKRKDILVISILFAIFFTFYYVFSQNFLSQIMPPPNDSLQTLQAIFNFSIVASLAFAYFLVRRLIGLHVIYAFAITSSALVALAFLIQDFVVQLVCTSAVGVLFGWSILAFFTYFWNLTVPEERGRVGGIVGILALTCYLVIGVGVAGILDAMGTTILTIILASGMLLAFMIKPEGFTLKTSLKKNENFPEKRTILLYAIPWILFSIVNSTLAKNISIDSSQQISFAFFITLVFIQLISGMFGAFGGSIIADFFGRRASLIISLTMYGTSSALAGFVQNPALLYFEFALNGFGWGILLVLYSFVIWGDLSSKESAPKMYAIGLIIFYAAAGIGNLPELFSYIPIVASSLISCFLIFLSNIPILLAPELLSQDFHERVKLRFHLNAVKKLEKQRQG